MDARQWEKMKPLLAAAGELPVADRQRFIEAACSDSALRAELLAMLASPAPLSDLTGAPRRFEAGTLLGKYRIDTLLGRGGMGEVYKAHDTRLGRDVAIKLLQPEVAADPDRMRRFHQEAQILAALSHPQIATIYGLEEADGISFLAMEYIPGESLAERIAAGRLSQQEGLRLATQIAEALEAAHRVGIIHRDLKPANVMLGPGGAKLLDFGLAKFSLAHADAGMTADGALLGTLQYMAPEQLEGRVVDARSDIFAFGCIVYEMLAGRRAFDAPSQAGIIASVLGREPEPLSVVRPDTPLELQHIVERCLAKDADGRWQTSTDLLGELRWLARSGATLRPAAGRRRRRVHLAAAWTVAAIGLAGWVITATRVTVPPSNNAVAVHTIVQPPGDRFGRFQLAVSRDGGKLAYRIWTRGVSSLWVQSVSTGETAALPNTATGTAPFFSPDGRRLGFCGSRGLQTVDLDNGSLVKLTPDEPCNSGTWNRAGTVLYEAKGSIRRIEAVGGPTSDVLVVSAPIVFFADPEFLPDGRHFLVYGEATTRDATGIYLSDVDRHETRFLCRANSVARYVSAGYLIYVRRWQLVAHPFDTGTLSFSGTETVVAPDTGNAFGVSDSGVLAYLTYPKVSELVWMSRSGARLGAVGAPGAYAGLRLSPDGTRVAYALDDTSETAGIWVHDLARDSDVRITAEDDIAPVWSPDGTQLVFSRSPDAMRIEGANGVGKQIEVLRRTFVWPGDWSPDGGHIAYTYGDPDRHIIGVRQLKSASDVDLALSTQTDNFNPRFSPNGRWLAYTSNEVGSYDVYVVPFPAMNGKWKVSTNGGAESVWRRDGKELFYASPAGDIMAVAVTQQGSSPIFGKPVKLFNAPLDDIYHPSFDVSADGERLLLNVTSSGLAGTLHVISNWTALLRK